MVLARSMRESVCPKPQAGVIIATAAMISRLENQALPTFDRDVFIAWFLGSRGMRRSRGWIRDGCRWLPSREAVGNESVEHIPDHHHDHSAEDGVLARGVQGIAAVNHSHEH